MQACSLDGQLKKAAVHFGSKSTARSAVIDSNSVASAVRPTRAMKYQWVPPSSVHEEMMITMAVSYRRMVICELQPVGHRN